MRGYDIGEINHGYEAQYAACEIDGGEREVLGHHTARQYAQTDAHIPRGEIRARGGGTPVVRGKIDVKGVVGGKHDAESHALEQGDDEEACHGRRSAPQHDARAGCQQQEGGHDQIEAAPDALRHVPAVHKTAGEQAGYAHACRQHGEKEAGRHVKMDFAHVHRHVVGGSAVGDGDEQQGNACGDAFEQDKAVQRQGGAFHPGLRRGLDAEGEDEAAEANRHAQQENVLERQDVVQEKADHGAYAHGRVVGQAVIAESFPAPRRRHDVYHERVAADGHHAEGQSVDHAEDDEQREQAADHITEEDEREHGIRHYIQGLARESVEQVAGKRPYHERGYGVAAKYQADESLGKAVTLFQIERKQRDEQPESEKQQEIGCQNAAITPRKEPGTHFGRDILFHKHFLFSEKGENLPERPDKSSPRVCLFSVSPVAGGRCPSCTGRQRITGRESRSCRQLAAMNSSRKRTSFSEKRRRSFT